MGADAKETVKKDRELIGEGISYVSAAVTNTRSKVLCFSKISIV